MTILTLGVVLIGACIKPEPPVAVLPENIITTINTDFLSVNVEVTADKANFYNVTFFEGSDSIIKEFQSGSAQHAFADSGVYVIRSRAFASYYDFIETWDTVEVSSDPSTPPSGAPSGGYSTPLTYNGMT
ncbi:MAG: hypothetical protein O3C46_06570, partial [Bacteroidetes bacterium]|nr:hypothetical protein [Bacteroidota bacterium]